MLCIWKLSFLLPMKINTLLTMNIIEDRLRIDQLQEREPFGTVLFNNNYM